MSPVDEERAPVGAPNGAEPEDAGLKSRASGQGDAMRTFGTLGTVGLSLVFAIAIGTAIGLWLDRLTGWSPLFFIVFFLFGLVAGILNLYRTVSRLK